MIRYWLDENPKATYSKFLGILSEDEEHRSTVDKQYTPEELIGTLVPSSKGKDKTLKKLFDRNQLSTLESVREHGINLLTSLVMSTQLNSKNSCLILKVKKQRFMYCFIAELIQTCISRSSSESQIAEQQQVESPEPEQDSQGSVRVTSR